MNITWNGMIALLRSNRGVDKQLYDSKFLSRTTNNERHVSADPNSRILFDRKRHPEIDRYVFLIVIPSCYSWTFPNRSLLLEFWEVCVIGWAPLPRGYGYARSPLGHFLRFGEHDTREKSTIPGFGFLENAMLYPIFRERRRREWNGSILPELKSVSCWLLSWLWIGSGIEASGRIFPQPTGEEGRIPVGVIVRNQRDQNQNQNQKQNHRPSQEHTQHNTALHPTTKPTKILLLLFL